jgi:hypothetical protein
MVTEAVGCGELLSSVAVWRSAMVGTPGADVTAKRPVGHASLVGWSNGILQAGTSHRAPTGRTGELELAKNEKRITVVGALQTVSCGGSQRLYTDELQSKQREHI